MSKNKDIENYCCPVGKQEDQNTMDTANWIGRGTDAVAERRVAVQKMINGDKED